LNHQSSDAELAGRPSEREFGCVLRHPATAGNGRGIPKIPPYNSERSITYYPRFTQSSEKSALARYAGRGGIIARGFRLAFDGSLSVLPT
jgi:hypothetical protein